MKHLLSILALSLGALLPHAATARPDAGVSAGPSAAIRGEVLETADVSGYTYLRLKTASGELWAAVPTATVRKGATVTVVNAMTMNNFQSRSLDRTFDRIAFGQLEGAAPAKGAGAGSMMGGMGAMGGMGGSMGAGGGVSPHGGKAPAAGAALVAKVPKASGAEGRTVAEVVQGRERLKDKTVSVRARVTKVNLGIMGKNWLHVQDGSGSLQDGSHDVLVTSQGTAAVGDVVTVRGTVRTDVTLGPGYNYAVLIEDAQVAK